MAKAEFSFRPHFALSSVTRRHNNREAWWSFFKVGTHPFVAPVVRFVVLPPQPLALVEARLVTLAARSAPVPLGHGRVVNTLKAVNGFHVSPIL
jgi:hypothetical protein